MPFRIYDVDQTGRPVQQLDFCDTRHAAVSRASELLGEVCCGQVRGRGRLVHSIGPRHDEVTLHRTENGIEVERASNPYAGRACERLVRGLPPTPTHWDKLMTVDDGARRSPCNQLSPRPPEIPSDASEMESFELYSVLNMLRWATRSSGRSRFQNVWGQLDADHDPFVAASDAHHAVILSGPGVCQLACFAATAEQVPQILHWLKGANETVYVSPDWAYHQVTDGVTEYVWTCDTEVLAGEHGAAQHYFAARHGQDRASWRFRIGPRQILRALRSDVAGIFERQVAVSIRQDRVLSICTSSEAEHSFRLSGRCRFPGNNNARFALPGYELRWLFRNLPAIRGGAVDVVCSPLEQAGKALLHVSRSFFFGPNWWPKSSPAAARSDSFTITNVLVVDDFVRERTLFYEVMELED